MQISPRRLVVALAFLLPTFALAQSSGDNVFLEPLSGVRPDSGPVPTIRFHTATEFDLPGPLPGAGPRRSGETVELPVAGGLAIASVAGDLPPRIGAVSPPEQPDSEIGLSPDGRFRVRPVDGRFLIAEKRCRNCAKGWKRRWKLRVPGASAAAPLVTDDRIYFAGRDNRIYCLKRRNGHQIWIRELDGRVSQRLVFLELDHETLNRKSKKLDNSAILLVVPGNGTEILAMEPRWGRRVGSYALGEDDGRIVGAPLPLRSGSFLIARQHFAPAQASLIWFEARSVASSAPDGEMPYNGELSPGPSPGS